MGQQSSKFIPEKATKISILINRKCKPDKLKKTKVYEIDKELFSHTW